MKAAGVLGIMVIMGATLGAGTDWKSEAPSTLGWRSIRRDMTMDEVLRSMPGEAVRDKDQKYKEGPIHLQAKLTKKVSIDGLDYEVTFGFDSAGRLDWLKFICNKTKSQSFESVTNELTELFGEPAGVSRRVYANGDSSTTTAWNREGVSYYVTAIGVRLNLLMTARLLTVSVTYK